MLREVKLEEILDKNVKGTQIWAFNPNADEPKLFELREVLKDVRILVDYKEPPKLSTAEVDCMKPKPAKKEEQPKQKRKYTKRKKAENVKEEAKDDAEASPSC